MCKNAESKNRIWAIAISGKWLEYRCIWWSRGHRVPSDVAEGGSKGRSQRALHAMPGHLVPVPKHVENC